MPQQENPSRGHPVRWLVICMAAAVVVAAAGGWWLLGKKVWTDGSTLRVADADTRVREIVWTAPEPLGRAFNTQDQEYEPSLSPAGDELYFVRGKPGTNAHIFVSYRRHDAWTAPVALDAVNGPTDDLGPRLTADGKFLVFYSDRPGGYGGYDIWAAPRAGDTWGKPFNLGPTVNSEFNEYSPDPTPDGRHLIFATNRKAGLREQSEAWRATIRQTTSADYDLWIADLQTGASPDDLQPSPAQTQPAVAAAPASPATQPAHPATQPAHPATQPAAPPPLVFSQAREIRGINTPYVEGASCMSPAGDFLYFSSDRPGGFGKFDLYRSRVTPDWSFGPPENLGPAINTADNEMDPALGLGGYRLYFASDRAESRGGYDLFASESREVFAQHQSHPLPQLGWSWWVMIGSILLMIPLMMLMRGWGDHRLTLLQRCLLLSVLIHVLISFALSFIVVTQQVRQYVKRETGVDIGLGLPKDLDIGLAIRNPDTSDAPHAAPAGDLQVARTPLDGPRLPAGPIQVNVPTALANPGGVGAQVAIPHVEPKAQMKAEVVAPQPIAPAAPSIDVQVALPRALTQADARQPINPAAPQPLEAAPNDVALIAPPQLTTGADPAVRPQALPAAQVAPPILVQPRLPIHAENVRPEVAPAMEKPEVAAQVSPAVRLPAQKPTAPAIPDQTPGLGRQQISGATPAPQVVRAEPAVPRAQPQAGGATSGAGLTVPTPRPDVRIAAGDATFVKVDPGPGAASPAVALTAPAARGPAHADEPAVGAAGAGAEIGSPVARQQLAAGPAGGPVVDALRAGAAPTDAGAAQSMVPAPAVGAPRRGTGAGFGGGLAIGAGPAKAAASVAGPDVGLAISTPRQHADAEAPLASAASEGGAPGAGRLARASADAAAGAGPGAIAVNAGPARPGPESTTQPILVASAIGRPGTLAGTTGDGPAAAGSAAGAAALVPGPEVGAAAGPAGGRQHAADAPIAASTGDGPPGPTTRPILAAGDIAAGGSGPVQFASDIGPARPADGPDALPGSIVGPPSPAVARAGDGAGAPLAAAPAVGPAVGPEVAGVARHATAGVRGATEEVPVTTTDAGLAGSLAPVTSGRDADRGAAPTGAAVPGAAIPASSASGQQSLISIASAAPLRATGEGPGAAGAVSGPKPTTIDDAISGPQVALPAARGTGGGTVGGRGHDQPARAEAVAVATRRTPLVVDGGGAREVELSVGPSAAPGGLEGGDPASARGTERAPALPRVGAIAAGAGIAAREAAPQVAVAPIPGTLGPGRFTAPDSPYSQRSVEHRKPLIEKLGGTQESEAAVDRALAYLARVQEPDGRWTFVADDSPPGRLRKAPHDMAYTSLATLAFLARDHAPNKPGPYRQAVSRGIDYLLATQGDDGDLRGPPEMRGGGSSRANLYDQAIATLALAETAVMTHDQRCTDGALAGARFIVRAQDHETGGWRYIPMEAGDTSVFGWQIMALHSAELLGFEVPETTRRRALKYIDIATTGRRKMLATYLPGGSPTPAMTAEMLFCRMLLGQHLADADVREATDFLAQEPPDLSRPDMYYWYYASLSMMQMQNRAWKTWNASTRDGLVRMQHRGGAADGAWLTHVSRGDRGGRIFTTAIGALTLEVYYRYGPLLAPESRAQDGDGASPAVQDSVANPNPDVPRHRVSRPRIEPN